MDNIKEKIQNLLNLSNDKGATEGEAQAALAMAEKLLKKYHLEKSDLKSIDNSTIKIWKIPTMTQGRWETSIWGAIGRLYFCTVYLDTDFNSSGKKQNKIHIVGTEENNQTCLDMGKFYTKMIRDMADRQCVGMGRSYKDSFLKGAASRLSEMVREKIQDRKKEQSTATGTSLITLESQLIHRNKIHLANKGIHLRSAGRSTVRSGEGYQHGRDSMGRQGMQSQIGQSVKGSIK